MKTVTMLATLLVGWLALGCVKPVPPVDPDKGKVKPVLVLKEEFEKIPEGTVLSGIKTLNGGYSLEFDCGTSIVMDNLNYGLVTVDSEDWICVNGDRTNKKFMSIPRYTVGPEGLWYSDGKKTYKRATPENTLAGEGDIHLTNVIDAPRSVTANFSDQSSVIFAKKRSTTMYVSKKAGQMDIFISLDGEQFLDYPFYKRYKAYSAGAYPSYLDNWGIGALELHRRGGESFTKVSTLFLRGEAEMALNVTSGEDPSKYEYVGGTLHGFENICVENDARCITMTVDGEDIAEDATFALREATTVVMTQKSLICQSRTNGNPFASVERRWTFENGDLHIRVDVTFLRDMEISQAQFGMLCVLRRWEGIESNPYLTCWAVKDSNPVPYDVTDGWTGRDSSLTQRDHNATRITEYGEKGLSFALCTDSDSDLQAGGGMFVGTNGNAYNKIYFDMLGRCSAKAGQKFHSHIHWEIDKTR